MDQEASRLAERVAEAADAWLRDPRDAAVYRRLVQAVDAWRTGTRPELDLIEPDAIATTEGTTHAEPHQLRGALADLADELRRRGVPQPPGADEGQA